MLKQALRTLAIMLVLLTAFYWFFSDPVKIDRCLDLGGRWDYEDKRCSNQ